MFKANQQLRQYAAEKRVKLWQIAEKLGINDGNFSRKLRRELPPDQQNRIIGIVDELAEGGDKQNVPSPDAHS